MLLRSWLYNLRSSLSSMLTRDFAAGRLPLAARPRRTTAAPGRPSPLPGTTGEGTEAATRRARTATTAARRRPRGGRRPRRDPARPRGRGARRRARPRGTSPAAEVRKGRKGRAAQAALGLGRPGPGRRRRRCARDGVLPRTRGTPTRRGRASSTTRPRRRRLR